MANYCKGIGVIWFVIACLGVAGQQVLESYPVFPETTQLREKLVALEQSQVGVRELTGKNDGKEVEMYLRYVGRKKGDAYCAAGQSWSHGTLGIPNPMSGWSPDWFRANLVYKRSEPRLLPFLARPGQVAGLYIQSKGRIGHVLMIKQVMKNSYITTEFNTNGMGSDEGQGVHNLIRAKSDISVIADYVGWREYNAGIKEATKKK
jgi:hypothetical protein